MNMSPNYRVDYRAGYAVACFIRFSLIYHILQEAWKEQKLTTKATPPSSGVHTSAPIIGGGGIFIYSCYQTVKTINFKRNQYRRTRIYEYAPPPQLSSCLRHCLQDSRPLSLVFTCDASNKHKLRQRQNKEMQWNVRHKHWHKHKHKHKTSGISHGITKGNSKENSSGFVLVTPRGKFSHCFCAMLMSLVKTRL